MLTRYLLIAFVSMTLPVLGQAKTSSTKTSTEVQVVQSVKPGKKDDGSVTVGRDTTKVETLKIDHRTAIKIDGHPGHFNEIKVGMKVKSFDVKGDKVASIDLAGKGKGDGKKKNKNSSTTPSSSLTSSATSTSTTSSTE